MQRKILQFEQLLRSVGQTDYGYAHSLPGNFYTDTGWLRRERDELFLVDWVCVGRVDEVARPGDFFTFDHVGEPILVVHGRDGVIRALANVCRHRGTVIADGSGNARKFLCPYHHWAYDTTGQLLNAPQLDANESFDRGNCRLPEIRLETWRGFLFVCFADAVPGLAASLAPLDEVIGNYHLEQMSLRYVTEATWETNWKCLLENFMEGYHLTPLHRDTLHKVNPSHLCRHLPPGELHFGYSVGFTERVGDARVGHPDLSDDELDTCVMFAVPPGFCVGVGSDYSSFLCLRPQAPDRVRVKMGLIFHGDDWRDAEVARAIELFEQTMDEDKQVLLRVQQGLGSRHHAPGPLAGRDLEGTIWDFYQYLGRRLGRDASGVSAAEE